MVRKKGTEEGGRRWDEVVAASQEQRGPPRSSLVAGPAFLSKCGLQICPQH